MTVLSKVLSGEVRVSSYDWESESEAAKGGVRKRAKEVFVGVKRPSDGTWTLEPNKGNIHEISAVETSAVLDVLYPPYSDERGCSYYRVIGGENGQGFVYLENVEQPKGLPVFQRYKG
eukprot:CAMPEP_0171453528 /NCGR_PEP_ID=MMETSP0945-20130129/1198_1 /TAXON_ID=109269 /ORGANISM="Vaucheria litorea, Strain CCMP2940" /LENGTH=117 /DNA_ID=CAMNT_0011978409 /DNA_START=342 /DNA_END=692 /DNA_ORIENTATION=+